MKMKIIKKYKLNKLVHNLMIYKIEFNKWKARLVI